MANRREFLKMGAGLAAASMTPVAEAALVPTAASRPNIMHEDFVGHKKSLLEIRE